MPVSWTLSRARRAEEDLEYLQNTMPLDTIRSVLQYCRSLKAAISACGHFMRSHWLTAKGEITLAHSKRWGYIGSQQKVRFHWLTAKEGVRWITAVGVVPAAGIISQPLGCVPVLNSWNCRAQVLGLLFAGQEATRSLAEKSVTLLAEKRIEAMSMIP